MNTSLRIFLQFLYRDFYIYRKQVWPLLINVCFIYPFIYAVGWGYLRPAVLLGNNISTGSSMYVGNILLILIIISLRLGLNLLFDLDGIRYVEYQVSLLDPKLVLLERIVFNSLFTFMLAAPFFPISKLILQEYLPTDTTSWAAVYGMLYLSSLLCATYQTLIACTLRPKSFGNLWARVNNPLLAFGGFWVPKYVITQFSSVLGIIILANPMLYVTEGLRQAFIGGPQFMPLSICAAALIVFSCLFTVLAWHFFKKRIDHI